MGVAASSGEVGFEAMLVRKDLHVEDGKCGLMGCGDANAVYLDECIGCISRWKEEGEVGGRGMTGNWKVLIPRYLCKAPS